MKNFQLELFPDLKHVIHSKKEEEKNDKQNHSMHKHRIERFRNLNLIKDLAYEDGYHPIVLKAVNGIVPRELVAFSKASRTNLEGKIVHFYEYDYIIDAIWRNPSKYIEMLKRATAVIGPDFSVNPRYPGEVNAWSLFKIRVISHYMQKNGITLIPNIPICGAKDSNYLWKSCESGGIYAISNVQAYNNYFSRHQWYGFVREVINRLNPESLIVYGNKMEISGVRTYYFDNKNIKNLRNGKK